VAARETPIIGYEVKLGAAERERLDTMIHGGKHPAQRLMRARILLKADTSEASEGWNDTQIARALETSTDTVAKTRRQLVEEGLDGALARKEDDREKGFGEKSRGEKNRADETRGKTSFSEESTCENGHRKKTSRKDGPEEAARHEEGREKKDVRQEEKLRSQ
jgi:hypothetical protein